MRTRTRMTCQRLLPRMSLVEAIPDAGDVLGDREAI